MSADEFSPWWRLNPTTVAVWCVALDDKAAETQPAMQRLLAAEELARAAALVFERDRRRFVVGRGILRVLLGRYLGQPPERIAFHHGPNGKPRLAPIAGSAAPLANLHFNVAHSGGLALYAFSRAGEVGVDLEVMRAMPDWADVAEATFPSGEFARLRACEPARQNEEFFRAWTRHEARLKASGAGLGGPAPAGDESSVTLHQLDAGDGFAAALAVPPNARWRGGSLVPLRASALQNPAPRALLPS